MTDARNRVLANIRRGLGREQLSKGVRDTLEARLRGEPGLEPLKPRLPDGRLADHFRTRLEAAAGSLQSLAAMAAVPEAVCAYRERLGLAGPLAVAPALETLGWTNAGLEPRFGPARGDETLCVSRAFAAVAETGSLVLVSGPETPTTLNFLPDHHLVVVDADDLVPHLEDAWQRLRTRLAVWPRTVNLVTGPSRTADVEQTIQLGAHGPRSLHVIWVGAMP